MFTFTLKDDWREQVLANTPRWRKADFGGPATAKAQARAIERLIMASVVVECGEGSTTYELKNGRA